MELGKQIKKYRNGKSWSQEALADKIYVSRQTISNWENGKSYPDVNSLVLLSEVFGVSLDQLIKGDIQMMHKEIQKEEQIRKEGQKGFGHFGQVFAGLFLAAVLTPIPLAYFLSYAGIGVWAVIYAMAMYAGIRIEKEKKKFDVHTYREILAFTEGKHLDEIEKAREEGKRPYQKILLVVASGAVALLAAVLEAWLLGIFTR